MSDDENSMSRSAQRIMTASMLMAELESMPPDAPIILNVVKDPAAFEVNYVEGERPHWHTGLAVESVPLEEGEVILMEDGSVNITVELTDYKEEVEQFITPKEQHNG